MSSRKKNALSWFNCPNLFPSTSCEHRAADSSSTYAPQPPSIKRAHPVGIKLRAGAFLSPSLPLVPRLSPPHTGVPLMRQTIHTFLPSCFSVTVGEFYGLLCDSPGRSTVGLLTFILESLVNRTPGQGMRIPQYSTPSSQTAHGGYRRFVSGTPHMHRVPRFSEGKEGLRRNAVLLHAQS